MLSFLFNKSQSKEIPNQLYGSLMAQSRQPFLFAEFEVPDTVMGRFDMLALHTYLFARRLKVEQADIASSLSQDVFDLFVEDIERALRELGIGDTTVPKRKKKMVRSFYGQIDDFDAHMDAKDQKKLAANVKSRYFGSDKGHPDPLAKYMLDQEGVLANQSFDAILAGKLIWSQEVMG